MHDGRVVDYDRPMSTTLMPILAALDEIGLPHRTLDGRSAATAIPCQRRGPIRVALTAAERTVTLRAFVLRAPDHNHDAVYVRILARNHDPAAMGGWSFSLDTDGDIYLVAQLALSGVVDALDGLLGALSGVVDATWPGLVQSGFAPTPPGPVAV